MTAQIWTVVPVRGIERGKSRLAPVLDAANRAWLNRWLLLHTLTEIERWRGDLRTCAVVSPCDEALELARHAGAAVVRETKNANGLNRALSAGLLYAIAHAADKVLVLPCDLPDLTAESLAAFASAARLPAHLVLAPDKSGTGTNALLADACPDLEFCFGERSYARHREWAAARGWNVSTLARQELEFDLDTPDDLAAWLKRGSQRHDMLKLHQVVLNQGKRRSKDHQAPGANHPKSSI